MSLNEIKNRIQKAEIEFSRKPGEVKLIAVSKVQPNERIEVVLEQGHRVFGENRVQEAQSKWPAFKEKYEDVELHIIGPLQTNKTRVAMEIADSIEEIKTVCVHCNKKAIVNAKFYIDSQSGDKVILHDGSDKIDLGAEEKYIPLCWNCWKV